MKALWNGQTLAESDDTILVEGNHYFPADSVRMQFFQPSNTKTTCGWKGQASYYNVVVDGRTNSDAARYYADTKPEAEKIRGRIAFWHGVEVVE